MPACVADKLVVKKQLNMWTVKSGIWNRDHLCVKASELSKN